MFLFQDTETTGLLDYKKDLMDFSQPRICALAASLTDEDGSIIEEMDVLIKPDGWTIEPGAAAVNGLSEEICEAGGIPIKQALERFNELKAKCKTRVGANVSYDKRMLLREARIAGIDHNSDGLESLCVLQMSKPFVPLAPGRRLPKLVEAYQYFMGHEMPGAHTAMGDVRAVQAVYFEIGRRLRDVKGVA